METRNCPCGKPLTSKQKKYCSKDCYWDAIYGVPKKGDGISIDSRGYPRYEYGDNRGRRVHVVVMEQKLGRPLEPGEVVDHKNHNKKDYSEKNLVLKQHGGEGGHASEHGKEYAPFRKRNSNGTFAKEKRSLLPRLLRSQEPKSKIQKTKNQSENVRTVPKVTREKLVVKEEPSNLPSVLTEFQAGASSGKN